MAGWGSKEGARGRARAGPRRRFRKHWKSRSCSMSMIGWLTRWDGTCRLSLAGITKWPQEDCSNTATFEADRRHCAPHGKRVTPILVSVTVEQPRLHEERVRRAGRGG